MIHDLTTRTGRVARASELRGQGKTLKEIAAELGVAISTAGEYLYDPDRSKLKERKAALGDSCVICGARTSYGSERKRIEVPHCKSCHEQNLLTQAEVRAQLIVKLWHDGLTLREIAAQMGWNGRASAATQIGELRAKGYDLPHRVPPDRLAKIVVANRRTVARRVAQRAA